ncbi:hypothetical protein JCGZ_03690 [Jatropha curcas]|uniref:Aminotransferase-like plant mobile domain-containing protein n=1 Tax=Jatropha curcas TaxID=180498 RepID=A0A067KWP0_JATCU|nr:hypothetical protein JCGZ_03690 [Jatropha curcas]
MCLYTLLAYLQWFMFQKSEKRGNSTATPMWPVSGLTDCLSGSKSASERLALAGLLTLYPECRGILDPLDLDVTRQFNWGAAALSYLYYGMDLCICGAHLKFGYRRVVEGDINASSLPQGRAWRFGRRYAHTTSDILLFRQLLNSLTWDQRNIHGEA